MTDDPASPRAADSGAWLVRAQGLRAAFGPGDVLAARFRIVAHLGSGGMGEVYEAFDLDLSETIALKTLRPELAADVVAVERFRREILLARKISHPAVCRTFDLFRHHVAAPPGWVGPAPDVHILTMELLRGRTLAGRLKEGRLPLKEAQAIAEQVAAGLAAGHQAGIVHRDLKPSNVMLVDGADGVRAVVTDFGLAQRTDGSTPSLTTSGMLAGTPAYMAPEQVSGGTTGPQTDVYALGVLLYEMVTGRRPFEFDNAMAMALARLHSNAPSPRQHLPSLDARWERVILRCLERAPEDRFAAVQEVARALREGVGLGPAQLRRRRRILLATAGVALAAGALGWVLATVQRTPAAAGLAPARPEQRRSVAVVGPRNLGPAQAAWLSTAIGELLAAELAAGEALRVVPGGAVSQARADIGLPPSGALTPDALGVLRRNLGVDLLVTGSFLASGDRLRIDVAIEDRSGATVAWASETGPADALLDLAPKLGEHLRAKLGLSVADASTALAARPATAEAARLYAEGLDRLRAFDAQGALRLLEAAAAMDPRSARIRGALSEAADTLGLEARAASEARRAYELSEGAPREERLVAEARWHTAAGQRDDAVRAWSVLFGFFRDNLEYGLHLARAQNRAAKPKDALATLDELRRLDASETAAAQIDLAEASAAEASGDSRRCQVAAARAAARSRAQGARFLQSLARHQEGWCLWRLSELDAALAAAEETRRLSEALGNRPGVARALSLAAGVAARRGELAAARDANLRAIAVFREVGDRVGASAALNALASLRADQGDLDGAARDYTESLALKRESGDVAGVAANLAHLARLARWRGNLGEARRQLQEASALSPAAEDAGRQASRSADLAEIDRLAGRLDAARAGAEAALRGLRAVHDRRTEAFALVTLGDVLLARGELAAARRAYEGALEIRARADPGRVPATRVALAALAIEESRAGAAEAALREALPTLAAAGRLDEETEARAILALALLARGATSEAREAAEAAWARGQVSPNIERHLRIGLAFARTLSAADQRGEARRLAEVLATEAAKAGLAGLLLEARLQAIDAAAGPASDRASLARDAAAAGYGLLARHAEATP